MKTLNLGQKAAHYAQEMVAKARVVSSVSKPMETLERLVTKTLGVLQEQGVYAMMLFLYSRSSDEAKIAPIVRAQLFRLLEDKDQDHQIPAFADKGVPADGAQAQTGLAFYEEHLMNDLDLLLLVRDLYEESLIYARYGAKAEG
ncbi:MAG: hypothetical protein M1358_15955 [Chloroflexi bacterium]|nr:hypothetical protein [Chloroflexota bacterium]